jgi:hypothetical protein
MEVAPAPRRSRLEQGGCAMTAGRRTVAVVLLAALAPHTAGCSWIFVTPPPDRPVPPTPPAWCVSSDFLPIVDTVIAGSLLIPGLIATTIGSASAESGSDSGATAALIGVGLTGILLGGVVGLSAAKGYERAKACREILDAQTACIAGVEASCRDLEVAPPPPPPPGEPPNTGAACSDPEDCKGGTECLKDDRGNGTCVEVPPGKRSP